MNPKQKKEIELRAEILEILAKTYRHSELLPKIRKLKRAREYERAIGSIHEIEKEMKKKKHESFRKKLRKKFKEKKKPIKRKKR